MLALICASSAGAQTARVTVRQFSEIAIYPQREAFATVVSLNDSRIAAEVSARIVEIPVEVGQIVAKGATLVRLDSRDYALAAERAAATVQSAESAYDLAQRQLARAQSLVSDGFISPEALNQREADAATKAAQLKAAKAEFDAARRNVRKCLVRAPFAAIVKERIGQVGELATPGAALVHILDASRIEISARVQPDDVAALETSKELSFEARTGTYPLKLRRIVPALDPRERNQEARFRFAKAGALPGTAGRVVWRSSQPHLPPDLVVRREGALGVFVAVGGKAKFVALPLAQEGRPVPADLDPAANVIIEGRYQLQNGAAVEPVQP